MKNTPRRYSLTVTHCEGIGILFVAFPVVTIVLSIDLSLDGYFNGVSEQKLFFNQPVEVRVGVRVLSTSKVNSPGGFVSFKSSFSQRFLIPTAL